jgi:hypothetical protein
VSTKKTLLIIATVGVAGYVLFWKLMSGNRHEETVTVNFEGWGPKKVTYLDSSPGISIGLGGPGTRITIEGFGVSRSMCSKARLTGKTRIQKMEAPIPPYNFRSFEYTCELFKEPTWTGSYVFDYKG